jgi:D-3-phosphoglycerate dehydrogenase
VIEAAEKLKVIGRAGVGLDNVDLQAATQKGIIVMNTPAGNTISTAEHTMSLILSLSRNIAAANISLRKGEWRRSKFIGVELHNKILGIIGLGKIGREVAKRAISFGMKILAYDPFLSKEVAQHLGVEVVELEQLLRDSDYISVHVPLTEKTKHMISYKEFARMKEGVRVVNCARGGIIDEEALVEALKEGRVCGAAIDVFEKEPLPPQHPLLKLENVVVTPHLGASTEEAQVNVAIEIAQSVRDYLLGRGIRNAANYPCLEPELCKIIEPYLNMAERLGSFASQLSEGRLLEVDINYSGQIVQYETSPVTLALVKGLLTPILQDTVNFVNAVSLARERGIKIRESRSSREEEFVNLVSARIKTDKEERVIAATLSANRQPRIVKVDEYYVELVPFGYMLVIQNWDKPGIIGNLGSLLGRHQINIAAMTFGRLEPGGRAVTVLNVDSPISAKILQEVERIENILKVRVIKI